MLFHQSSAVENVSFLSFILVTLTNAGGSTLRRRKLPRKKCTEKGLSHPRQLQYILSVIVNPTRRHSDTAGAGRPPCTLGTPH